MKQNAFFLEISCFVALFLAVLLGTASFENDCRDIRNEVLRLHVIANSDSEEDQALKLAVRDALLEKSDEIFSGKKTKETAEKAVCQNLSLMLETAEQVLKKNGVDENVCVSVGKSRFPTRTYSSITLPAGEYDALRVVIGEGKGKNWWCVMFPPLCLPAAEGEERLDDVLNESELELVQSAPRFEIRFWLVEKFEELKTRFTKGKNV